MKRVLIIGGNGMLGHKLLQVFKPEFEVFVTVRRAFEEYKTSSLFDRARTLDKVDLMNEEPVASVIADLKPDVVVNAAGIVKQVPSAQDTIATLTVNSILPHRLAALSKSHGFRLICVSTDCVFSGSRGNYSEEDVPDATDLYGKSKNLGEVIGGNCLTLRTSIIGRELGSGYGLLEWFLSNRNDTVKGFAKAVFSGFPTVVFSRIIRDLVVDHPDLRGLYHVSSEPISKFELLNLIKLRFGTESQIDRDEEYEIDRSLNSTKFKAETGFVPLSWPEMIDALALDSEQYNQ